MVGVQGSALNKWPRGVATLRDMDTASSSSPPTDKSNGKGIYNLTLKSDETLDQTKSIKQPDVGEEVYGCISAGYSSNEWWKGGQFPTIEYEAEIPIKQRKKRGNYAPDAGHFSAVGRKWTGGIEGVKECTDFACIPTENLPLVANSKFPIKYWIEKGGTVAESKMVEIPSGAGFTSGALVRPLAFSKKAEEIPNGALAIPVSGGGYACKLSNVPISTAHAILNRCKEISISGSVSMTLTRTTAKCEGPLTSTKVWEDEERVGCPPGTCLNKGGSETIQCVSTQAVTKVKLSGAVDMTAYRYKQLANVWKDDPETIDLSGNYFYGSKENGAYLRKFASSYCDYPSDSEAMKGVPNPTIEKIGQFEKQTKLSSGCLVYPETNASILLATEEKNLASIELNLKDCQKSGTKYSLDHYYSINQFVSSVHPGGARVARDISPLLISGPSLSCRFNGSGWDWTGVGSDKAEDLYTKKCKDGNNFPDYKGKWNSTGIKTTIESGKCEAGLFGLMRYGRSMAEGCKCGDPCSSSLCKSDYGTLKLRCECTPLCSFSDDENQNPCLGEYPPSCDGFYGFAFDIGKYVGVETDASTRMHTIAPIPLSAKSDTKTEDLTLFWNGFISDNPEMGMGGVLGMPLMLGEESAATALLVLKDNSTTTYEKRSVGALTIVCQSWSTSVPLWTVLGKAKKTTCKGAVGATNVYGTTTKGFPSKSCNECERYERCCSEAGCNGFSGEETECCDSVNCGIADPCGFAAEPSAVEKGCDKNMFNNCAGSCEFDGEGENCGCCNCHPDGGPDHEFCDIQCPPMITCAPYTVTKDHKALGCYGDAHEEDDYVASANLTLTFKLFTQME
jgi:hypothetical protein